MSDCKFCPDGHTPTTEGSQRWAVWVSSVVDGDGQPTSITVARTGGAHVAESDAQWLRDVLNGRVGTSPPAPLLDIDAIHEDNRTA